MPNLTPAAEEAQPVQNLAVPAQSDTVDLTAESRWVYVGTGGDLKVVTAGGQTVTLASVPGGSQLPIRVKRIFSTGTTATGLMIGW